MRKAPNILDVREVVRNAGQISATLGSGEIVPARALGFYGLTHRLHAAWLVFTGRADALTWPGQ